MELNLTNLLFVYGTLKKNFHNHYLLQNQKFLGEYFSYDQNFVLAHFKGSSIPCLLKPSPEFLKRNPYIRACQIKGELYACDKFAFKQIDRLEGHPNLYKREIIKLVQPSGNIAEAWTYVYPLSSKIELIFAKPKENSYYEHVSNDQEDF